MARDNGWRELSESLAFGGIPMRRQKKPVAVKKTLEEWFETIYDPQAYKEFFPVVYIEKDDNYLKVGWIRICKRANEITAEKGCERRTAMRWSLAEYFFEERSNIEP
jgi:hypothetical protein